MEKYKIEKNSVQETLIIPLYGRRLCSQRFPELYQDTTAAMLIEKVEYDFSRLERHSNSLMHTFGALEVAMRQNDLETILKSIPKLQSSIWDAVWTIPGESVTMAIAASGTSICRKSLRFGIACFLPEKEKKTWPLI